MFKYSIAGSWLKAHQDKRFDNVQEVVAFVVEQGICPSCKVLREGKFIGYVEDFIVA